MSDPGISDLAWGSARLGEGLVALARRCGLSLRTEQPPPGDPGASPEWIDAAARWLGVDAVSLELPHPELETFLRSPGPAIVGVDSEDGETRYLLLAGSRLGRVEVLGEDGALHRRSWKGIARELESSVAATATDDVERLLRRTELRGARREAVREHMVGERLHGEVLTDLWLLRASPGALLPDVRRAGLPRLLSIFGAAYLADYLLFLASWWLLGRGALAGQMDLGWLAAWALLFVTMLPFRAASTWYEGRIAVAAGGLLKRRLLLGAMRLRPDETRRDGVGRHLSRVNESQAVESLALDGGLLSLAATVELLVGLGILALGAGGLPHALLLALTMLAFGLVAARTYHRRRDWVASRLSMSHELVERMVGHRTRLAQERPDGWHEGEDGALARHLERSGEVDAPHAYLVMFERIWLPVGILGLAPAFVAGGLGLGSAAVGLGGTILASRAFRKLGAGFTYLIEAVIAWKQLSHLSDAASRKPRHGDPSLVALASNGAGDGNARARSDGGGAISPSAGLRPGLRPGSPELERAEAEGESRPASAKATAGPPKLGAVPRESEGGSEKRWGWGPGALRGVLAAHDLSFTYPRRAVPVLRGVEFAVRPSDRVLLTSPSGGGKSTLVSILNGLREPDTGMVLLDGVDRPSLGAEAWTRRLATAPQFHENHVFTETFAFNLLMGRRWPPTRDDWQEARSLCEELGLGELLRKMPGEMNQMVGDTGWQLSHGERSRLYLARALLQGGDVVLLDESFAALDPDNLRQALVTARHRAKSLVVIAHP